MDAIERASSGHSVTPMGVAPVAYTSWQRFLRFDPGGPIWPDRDERVAGDTTIPAGRVEAAAPLVLAGNPATSISGVTA